MLNVPLLDDPFESARNGLPNAFGQQRRFRLIRNETHLDAHMSDTAGILRIGFSDGSSCHMQ